MSGHDTELDQLRAGVSCASLLERLQPGWLLDKGESTAKCLKYRRGAGEVLIVNHGGRGWWDPMSDAKGDVFSLTQHLDPRLNFGQVRKLLRGMLGVRPSHPELERKPGKPDKPAVPVAQLWARRRRLSQGSATWGYLTGERALPPAVLQAADLFDAVREGPHGSAWFAHRDHAGVLTGTDMRGPDWRGFSQQSDKSLFRLPGGTGRLARLAVCEAPIDALSLAALEGLRADTLYLATTGGMGRKRSPASMRCCRTLRPAPTVCWSRRPTRMQRESGLPNAWKRWRRRQTCARSGSHHPSNRTTGTWSSSRSGGGAHEAGPRLGAARLRPAARFAGPAARPVG
jgi:hypothetical protein